MTIEAILKKINRKLMKDAEVVLAEILNKDRSSILTHPEKKLGEKELKKWLNAKVKLKKGWPVAYILGHKEFYGLDFLVTRATLIPRPETELMVKIASEEIEKLTHQKIYLVDVGTGTGCVPISIIKTIKNKDIKTYAIDISKPALAVAKKNAKHHDVEIKYLRGDLLNPIFKDYSSFLTPCSFIITANLPYLTAEQIKREPTIKREPRLALFGGKNGLALYEKLLKQTQTLLLFVNCSLSIFFEIDPSQNKKIIPLIKKFLPNAEIKIEKDLAGHDRLVLCRVSS